MSGNDRPLFCPFDIKRWKSDGEESDPCLSGNSCLHLPQRTAEERTGMVYRGEGNSNLVIALKQEKKVIRILKADAKQLKSHLGEEVLSLLNKQIVFSERVIPLLIPNSRDLHRCPKVVELSENEVQTIRRLVENKRPRFRLNKSIPESKQTFALLLPDYCVFPKSLRAFRTEGPLLALEIKPKQGFLPKSALLSEELRIKSRICRYGLSQFHKLEKRSIRQMSQYCPLDLFSGCPKRMSEAVKALIRNPQNNFRLFRDQTLVYGSDLTDAHISDVLEDFFEPKIFSDSLLGEFARLVVRALCLPLTTSQRQQMAPQELEGEGGQQWCALHGCANGPQECCSEKCFLPFDCILFWILRAQRLDQLDSELAQELAEQELNGNQLNVEFLSEAEEDNCAQESCLRKIWQFLVSLTAKDCSIMIAMQRLAEDSLPAPVNHVISVEDKKYLVNVAITDLDQKSAHKIKRTLSNDRRMVRAYNKASLQTQTLKP